MVDVKLLVGAGRSRSSDLVKAAARVAAAALVAAAVTAAGAMPAATAVPVMDQPGAVAAARLVATTGDAAGLPYAVVDKRAARMLVFDAGGRLVGSTPVLLGAAAGDHTLPGTGERTQLNRLRPEDRTTPAGRFAAQAGRNAQGERVIWVDPEAAFAIHRVRPGPGAADRHRRLAAMAAGAPASRARVSAGCVVVPPAFFDRVVQPVLGRGRSVVYVLPERRGWQDL